MKKSQAPVVSRSRLPADHVDDTAHDDDAAHDDGTIDAAVDPAPDATIDAEVPSCDEAEERAAGDRRLIIVFGSLFLIIMTVQYLSLALNRPEPLPWQRGEAFQAFRVDINSATWIEWSQLDGIGPTLAHRIVADRKVNGPFRTIDDLARVEGIGPVTLNRIRPWLSNGDNVSQSDQSVDDSSNP